MESENQSKDSSHSIQSYELSESRFTSAPAIPLQISHSEFTQDDLRRSQMLSKTPPKAPRLRYTYVNLNKVHRPQKVPIKIQLKDPLQLPRPQERKESMSTCSGKSDIIKTEELEQPDGFSAKFEKAQGKTKLFVNQVFRNPISLFLQSNINCEDS